MLISHKYKFLTIDIPKTGTRSFRETLHPLGIVDIFGEPSIKACFYQHGTAISLKKQFTINHWNWNDYFKYTVVRNPWARYFSFFKYLKLKSELYSNSKLMGDYLNSKSDVWQHSGLYQKWINQEINHCKQSFDFFSSSSSDQTILKNIILTNSSQDSYYCDTNGQVIVNHIAEFENLSNEFIFLCNKVGINTPSLQHGNKSTNSLKACDIYNQELIDLVYKKEKNVIKLKDYNFN